VKQRIEPTDLEVLTDAQKQRLRELWEPQVGNFMLVDTVVRLVTTINNNRFGVYLFYYTTGCCQKQDCLPILSIGQMIEILQKNNISNDLLSYCNTYIMRIECEDICDALWQAVKEIL